MTSPAARTAKRAVAHAPFRAAGQRNVDLLGDMVMVGIDDVRAEDRKPAGDLVVGEMAARAEHLQPAVIVDEVLAEIGGGVGLAPAEIAARARASNASSRRSRRRRRSARRGRDGRGTARPLRRRACAPASSSRSRPRSCATRLAVEPRAGSSGTLESSSSTICRHGNPRAIALAHAAPARARLRGRIIGLD